MLGGLPKSRPKACVRLGLPALAPGRAARPRRTAPAPPVARAAKEPGLGASARAQAAAATKPPSGARGAVIARPTVARPRAPPRPAPGSRAAEAALVAAAAVAAGRPLPPPTAPTPPAAAPPPPLARAAARARGLIAAAPAPLRCLTALASALWLLLPFALRRLAWPLVGAPPPPSLHASPRAAALRAAAARGDGAAAVRALGYGADGRLLSPLDDTPRWRLEALVGRGLSRADAARLCSALTLPSAAAAGSAFERLEYLGDAVLELAARQYALAR